MKKCWNILLVSIVLVSCLLSGCRQSIDQSPSFNDLKEGQTDAVTQGAEQFGVVSVDESGIFFMRFPLLYFYDYGARKEFVLCDQANCTHDDGSCAAYVGGSDFVTGYARYQGDIYLIQKQPNTSVFELISMDVGGRNRKVVASLPIAAPGSDGWQLNSLDSIYYGEGFAWAKAHYRRHIGEIGKAKTESAVQLLSIDLDDGQIYPLTELMGDDAMVNFSCIGNGRAVYRISMRTPPLMSEDEYYAQAGETGDYQAYADSYFKTTDSQGTILLFSTADKQISTFWEGTLINVYEEDNPDAILWQTPPYIFYAFWENSILYGVMPDASDHSEILSRNLDTGEVTSILTIKNGGLVGRYMGEINNTIYEGNKIYYLIYDGEGSCVIHSYHLDTGEDERLFTDIAQVSFRIISETSDKLIGTMNGGSDLCWITKDDYENGNLKSAVKVFPLF